MKVEGVGVYSMKDVKSHDNAGDCWIVIEQSVYDVTRFIRRHPGGPSSIVAYCGKNAT